MKKQQCVVCKSNKFTILFPHHNRWVMGKCVTCGLVQVVPMPTRREIAALYHEDFEHFDPYIEQERVHHEYFRKKLSEISKRITINDQRTTLLDIGCASGVLLEEAEGAGMKAAGVDISRDVVAFCKKKGLTAYAGTVSTVMNLRPASFDVITAFQVIEHERDPLNTVKRIYKLLKKGGVVVLATPNYGGIWRKLMGRRWFGFAHPEHVVLFDFKTIRIILKKAGFRDIEARRDTPRPFPLSFAFTRGADYFPWAAWILKPVGKLLNVLKLTNPINPWDDMIAYGRK